MLVFPILSITNLPQLAGCETSALAVHLRSDRNTLLCDVASHLGIRNTQQWFLVGDWLVLSYL